jgi:DNA-binding NtrC family response regulator
MRESVLVVDDDQDFLEVIADDLNQRGFVAAQASGVATACNAIQRSRPFIIVTDYSMRDGDAFDLLAWLRVRDLAIPVIVMTGHGSIDLAVKAIKSGADQFVTKPVDFDALATILTRVVENQRIHSKETVHQRQQARHERDPFLGQSAVIQQMQKEAHRIAATDTTVLIQGETGSGKGVLARWLHRMSPRASGAFLDINCAGLSRELLESELFGFQRGAFTGAVANKIGLLEAAHGGTVFLDEIGEMDPLVQAKVLKVVEEQRFYRLGDVRERAVDVRLIAATHGDLKQLVANGKFRNDLYFRISALRLRTPALRERIEDIPILAEQILQQLLSTMGRGPLQLTEEASKALQRYSWPGNIRELRNVLERAALLSEGDVIHKTGLEFEASPENPVAMVDPLMPLAELERLHIERMLDAENGNVIRTAERLGISRSSLYVKIQQYGLGRRN